MAEVGDVEYKFVNTDKKGEKYRSSHPGTYEIKNDRQEDGMNTESILMKFDHVVQCLLRRTSWTFVLLETASVMNEWKRESRR